MKTIIKEILIFTLLLVIILLVLGILFYEYNPMSKTLPMEVSYKTPEIIKTEIENAKVDGEAVVLTYSINSTDLQNYKRTSDYVPGKANPFEPLVTEEEKKQQAANANNNTTSSSTSGTSTNNSNTSSSSGSTTSSGGEYFDDEGTK